MKNISERPHKFNETKLLKILMIVIGSVILICIAVTSVVYLTTPKLISTSRPTAAPAIYIPSTTDASYMCQKFVENRLKAPSTAKFQRFYKSTAVAMANNIFQIISYVDSENSFGAMIRTDFVCKIQYVGNDQWELVDLTTSP